MNDALRNARDRVGNGWDYLRAHMWVLFVVAIILGAGIKFGAGRFLTIGYNDYLAERNVGINFDTLQEEAQKKQQEAAKKAQENGTTADASAPALPTGGSCGN